MALENENGGNDENENESTGGFEYQIPSEKDNELVGFVNDHCERWRNYRDTNYLALWEEYERIFRGQWSSQDKMRDSERVLAINKARRNWQMVDGNQFLIPGIVNTFIGLFKDTTLVAIVGIFDFLRTVDTARIDPVWAGPTISTTGYIFAAAFYFVFCFGMSRYSLMMERRLSSARQR